MYDAFISYSRRDVAFAQALERRLERYRPPRALGLPHRRLSVFRDEGDLTGSEYFSSIERALSESSKLIVVCSPDARESSYVNDEIRRFVAVRGPEHIIPILLRGTPGNEASDESGNAFPPALFEVMEMPLAVDYLGFDAARPRVDGPVVRNGWYTLLANVLDRSRDEVEERDLKRIRTRRLTIGGGSAAVLAVIGTATVYGLVQAAEARARARAEALAVQRGRAERIVAVAEDIPDPLDAALVLADLIDLPEPARGVAAGVAIAGRGIPSAISDGRMNVFGMAISADGSMLALASDSRIFLWSSDGRGDPVLLVPAEEYGGAYGGPFYRDLAFSPDGSLLAAVTHDARLLVWSVDGGSSTVSVPLPPGSLDQVRFTADGERVAVSSREGTVYLVPADGSGAPGRFGPGRPTETRGTPNMVIHVAPFLDPEGRRAVTVPTDGGLELWSPGAAGSVRLPWSVAGFTFPSFGEAPRPPAMTAVALDPTGRAVAAGASDGSLRVWPLDGSPARDLVHPYWRYWVRSLEFAPDGRSLLVVGGNRVWIWPLDGTGEPRRIGGLTRQDRAAFSPDGRYVVTVTDPVVQVWDATEATPLVDPDASVVLVGTQDPILTVRDTSDAGIQAAVFMSDGGTLVTRSGDWRVRVWPLLDLERGVIVQGHSARITHGAFSPDDRYVATASEDSTVRVFAVDGGTPPRTLRGHQGSVTRVAFGPDGRTLASGSEDGTVRVWPLDGEARPAILEHDDAIVQLALSPDGAWLVAVSDDETTRIWPTRGGEPVLLEDEIAGPYSPDGQHLVTVDSDQVVRIRPADGKGEGLVLGQHDDDVEAFAWSRDGRRLVTGSDDQTVAIWATDGGEILPFQDVDVGDVEAVALSPGDSILAVAGDNGVVMVRAQGEGTGTVRFRFPELEEATALAFGASGALLLVSADGVEQWLLAGDGSGRPRLLEGPGRADAAWAGFSHDGSLLVAGWEDGSASVRQVGWRRLLDDLRARTSACLSAEQRREYLGEAEAEAQDRFEACERGFGRDPRGPDASDD